MVRQNDENTRTFVRQNVQSNKNSKNAQKVLFIGQNLIYNRLIKQIKEDVTMRKYKKTIAAYIKVISFIVMLGMAEPVASLLIK